MNRMPAALALLALLVGLPATAADLARPAPLGRFRATCEDLARVCFADVCGRDQIEAAEDCRARCPGSVVMSVVPQVCPLAGVPATVVLRRRG